MSSDLLAAFEDFSQPPQQARPNNPSSQSTYTPFSLPLSSNPSGINPIQPWSQSFSVPNQPRHERQASQPLPTYNTPPAPVATSTLEKSRPTDVDDAGDDDGWGDFEVAPNTAPSPGPVQTSSMKQYSASSGLPIRTASISPQPTRHTRTSTLDLPSNDLGLFQEASINPTWPPVNSPSFSRPPERKVQTKATNTKPNVLFDADDFEGGQNGGESDDDFGEFETVSPTVQSHPDLMSSALPVPQQPSRNVATSSSELLLDLNFSSEPAPAHNQPPKSTPVFGQAAALKQEPSMPKPYSETARSRNALARMSSQLWEDDWGSPAALPKQTAKSPIEPVASTADWAWDPVESPKPTRPSKPPVEKTPSPQSNDSTTYKDDTSWDWDAADEPETGVENSALPPVNIPPPSIMLSAFPQLIDQANDHLYKPVSKQPPTIKDRILSDPRVYDFLEGYLNLATVAARIIVGRRLRWHRDKFLSQSMSISAAGSKGMKLAGVDKAQTAREDREAADVVSSWKSQLGRLKSTVAAANSANKRGGKALKIPEISDTMHIEVVKGVPTAAKACVICGLKRNERLTKVDYEVEDSFGEWWVEHWGHVACKRFWLQHENTLRQR
ncbi:hypothetical protein GGS21DRAFT_473808 [Xylaria nigripes]|nr:hypothetical protein GGS21DRAFT_473808 [Xylaria nigripes]